ncbi:MAG: carnitine 3-dehydrogenase [Janthinobacterium lividum]
MSRTESIGLVGGGVIGAGWVARFLLDGHDCAVFDPDPDLARKLDAVIANARRARAKLMPGVSVAEGTLRIAASVADAVAGASFVVESLPEVEALKIRVLGEIDTAAGPEVVIASSTSGLLPTRLAAGMAHPERLVVGHPFNPVYLLPLVEVCGGEKTVPAAQDRAAALYESVGMRVLRVRKEIDGFVADRLLEALWREALWLVEDGVATTEEIDDAIRYGAGLRWSFMGTFLIYRLAGGEAGMRHFLAQFGPALKLPWTKLVAPELTDALVDRVSDQSDAQAEGVSIRELERKRDDCLVAVLSGLRGQDYAAGAVVAAHERALRGRDSPDGATPLDTWTGAVLPEWIDYNGHMTEHRYLQCFGEATDALLARIGVDAAYLATKRSFYTVETHLIHRGEAHAGEALKADTQVLGADGKRLHVFHRLLRAADGTVLASAEQMLLHVDTKAGRSISTEGAVREAIDGLAREHVGLARPEAAGRSVGIR